MESYPPPKESSAESDEFYNGIRREMEDQQIEDYLLDEAESATPEE